MKSQRVLFVILGLCIGSAATQIGANAADTLASVRQAADGWRRACGNKMLSRGKILAWFAAADLFCASGTDGKVDWR